MSRTIIQFNIFRLLSLPYEFNKPVSSIIPNVPLLTPTSCINEQHHLLDGSLACNHLALHVLQFNASPLIRDSLVLHT